MLEANTTNTIAKNLSGSYFKIDVNNDGEIQQSEAIQVSYLNVQDSNINTITGLDYFTNLQTFGVTNNSLADLPVGNLVQLSRLNCQFNDLQSLDVSNNHNLLVLYCVGNQITSLNLNECPNLFALRCEYNNLTSLALRNGSTEIQLYFDNNPNLLSLCGDDNEIAGLQNYVNYYGYTNCVVSADCNLSNQNFDISNALNLYPNPVKDVLHIDSQQNIVITDITIYNAFGASVLGITDSGQVIDVSFLQAGIYFIKTVSARGVSISKFIKQ